MPTRLMGKFYKGELEEEKEPELEELQKISKLKFYKDSEIDAVTSATTSKCCSWIYN